MNVHGSYRWTLFPAAVLGLAAMVQHADATSRNASVRFDPARNEVTITIQLPDSADLIPAELRPGSVAVYENGVRQKPVAVEVEHTPVSIGMLVEHGGRYSLLNEALGEGAADAVSQFLNVVGPDDRVAVWQYGDRLEEVAPLAHPDEALRRTLSGLPVAPPSEANFYDALAAALSRMQQWDGRKALVVVSTGVDTFSRTGFQDALRLSRQAGIPIYAINLAPLTRGTALLPVATDGAPYADLDWQEAQSRLERIANTSGGRMYSPQFRRELESRYDDLLARLRLRYVVHYTPGSTGTGAVRTVRVILVKPGSRMAVVDGGKSSLPAGNGARDAGSKGRLLAEADYVAGVRSGA